MNKCSKLVKKYKTRHEWVEKVIHLEWCKKFDHTNNPESIPENATHKRL